MPDIFEDAHVCLDRFADDAAGDPDKDGLSSLSESALNTDPCDSDTDEDQLADGAEVNVHGTNPLAADTEGDGMPDGFEVAHNCLDPLVYDSTGDADGDGLSNYNEFVQGMDPCAVTPTSTPTQTATSTATPTASPTATATDTPCTDFDGDTVCDTEDSDDDNDGCSDAQEIGVDETLGGGRDPMRFWDVFDTPTGDWPVLARDKAVSGLDFFAVLARFGTTDGGGIAPINRYTDPLSLPPEIGYHPAFDRGASSGPNPWNLTAANGAIAGTDFFGILTQFGHSCA